MHAPQRRFDLTLDAFAGLLVVLLLIDVALGVVTRALGDPLDWTDEGARFLMVWLACVGWVISSRRRLHVRIRYFQEKLPATPRRVAEVVIQSGILLLSCLVAWHGVDLVRRNYDLDATSLPISMAWMYVPLAPTGLITALQALHEIAAQKRSSGAPSQAAATVE